MGKKGKKKLLYRGITRHVQYNPWLELEHGKRYEVDVHIMESGKVRALVKDGFDRVRIFYKDKEDFDKEWCK